MTPKPIQQTMDRLMDLCYRQSFTTRTRNDIETLVHYALENTRGDHDQDPHPTHTQPHTTPNNPTN